MPDTTRPGLKLLFRRQASPRTSVQKLGYGLHTLVQQNQDDLDATDIVTIHGLNGHCSRTWIDETTGFNWPLDAILRAIPKARVMAFSYNSAVQFSKSTSDFFTFADQLLECLLTERSSAAESRRPLVFVCHSLGGLVFKQAVIRSHESQRYASISAATIGVMFFGTPHQGSSFASWGTLLGNLLKAASLGSNTNTQLTKDLEPGSGVLELMSRTFLEHAENLNICTMYETQKMDFLSALVVDKKSACLGLQDEVSIPLNGNHRTICRFTGLDDKSLRLVLNNLSSLVTPKLQPSPMRLYRGGRAAAKEQEENELLDALNTSEPDVHMGRNPQPVHGICTWILRHATYKSWSEAPASALLWLSADAGCGKSVLASFLVGHYLSSGRWNVCYFFFKSNNDEQRDGVHALQAVLRQLYLQQRELVPIGCVILTKSRLRSVETLWKAIVASAEHPNCKDTICILDGLDECDMASKGLLLNLVSKHFSRAQDPNPPQPRSRLKLLITSRPDNNFKVVIEGQMPRADKRHPGSASPQEGGQNTTSIIRLRGEDEVDAISDDVSMVVKSDIVDLENQGLPSNILSDIQAALISRADRTFLWVALILQLLKEKVEAGASRRELDQILESRDIYDVYSGLLQGRENTSKAERMLHIILAASRPMTVEELSIALAIRLDSDHSPSSLPNPSRNLDDVEFDMVFPFENHIKSLCGHFVRIIRNRVYLVHETAREFLLELSSSPHQPAQSLVPWQHSFPISSSRRILLNICVAYLYCLGWQPNRASYGCLGRQSAPFLDFAATEWVGLLKLSLLERTVSRDAQTLSYYHNLFHPRFPGFRAWMPKALKVSEEVLMKTTGISDDDLQDYYMDLLLARREDRQLGDQPGLQSGTIEHCLSSNPGALSNHYFPLTVDARGVVRLDFSKGPQNKPRRGST
ncbi:ankyrin repeat protein [Chaetomium tenue]|uniref:Ankyrin repeat protein n=1 Tax=Chaetomium tenue TaxID=1854479 RepID=A0ACB7NYQ7_9PEZI|nr:ankyrin repeat protein [Chaetomium globosum]